MTPLELQLLGSAITVIGSGVLSALLTQRLTAKRAELDFRRKKLEELFLAVHSYCNKLTLANLVWLPVMKGDMDYNAALEQKLEKPLEKDRSYETATMLIHIYFPELAPAFEAILARRERINRIHADFKRSYLAGSSCVEHIQPFGKEVAAIDEDEKAISTQIFRIGDKLNG